MTFLALTLILVAAFFHATWNLLAKRVGSEAGTAVFVWLSGSLAVVLYAPLAVAVLVYGESRLGPPELLFMLGSGVLHLGYFLLLQRGYAVGDLSLVYPLARGTGPLLATAAAIAFFGERPSLLALCGMVLIVGGVFLLTRDPKDAQRGRPGSAVAYGLATGVFIAAYTLWDKHAVSALLVPPLLQDWASNLVRALLITPLAARRRGEVRALWRAHKAAVLGVAALAPLAYILVLTALVFTPVSYVAPVREVSILIATAMGAQLLVEGDARRRLLAAGAVVAGVVALALG
jgi:drug/metabolite transporter (DMT)-like permease